MFQEKARFAQKAGAIGVIVIGKHFSSPELAHTFRVTEMNYADSLPHNFRQPSGIVGSEVSFVRYVRGHRDRGRHRDSGGIPLPLRRTKVDKRHSLVSDGRSADIRKCC